MLKLTADDELMVVGVAPWIYLYSDAGCGNYSTWQVHEGSTQLHDYYELHPDKFPDVVYMAHWAEEFMACDLSHLFTDRGYTIVYPGNRHRTHVPGAGGSFYGRIRKYGK